MALLEFTPSHGMVIDAIDNSSLSARKKQSIKQVFINVDEGTDFAETLVSKGIDEYCTLYVKRSEQALAEERGAPARDEEFVLAHSDNVQATGFVEHLKLPHYVDFQAELALVRQLRREHAQRQREAAE